VGIFPFPGQRLGWMRDLLHEERYSSIRLWGLSLNFTLEEMVHPYVMVHFCVYIYTYKYIFLLLFFDRDTADVSSPLIFIYSQSYVMFGSLEEDKSRG
jgi:hypothetical protein